MSDEILEGMIRQSTDNPLQKEERLPILVIKEVRDVPYVEIDIEAEDDAFDVIVEMGKEHATEEDYFNIGLRKGIENYLNKNEKGRNNKPLQEREE